MIRTILASFIKDILPLTSAGFFETSQDKKRKLLNDSLGNAYPHTLKDYLEKITLAKLVSELQQILPFLRKERAFNTSLELSETLRKFLTTEFAGLVDTASQLHNISEPKTTLEKTLKILLKKYPEEELYTRISHYNLLFKNSSTLRVQTPFSLGSQDKQSMRQELNKKFPRHFIKFSVEPALVGGMRLFKDGEMIDLSWRSRVKQFTFSRST